MKMPARARKACKQRVSDSLRKKNRTEDEKENICLDNSLKDKKNGSSIKLQSEQTKAEKFKKSNLSPPKQNLKVKAVGFWSKKLHDLEAEEGTASAEKYSLYEFDETDELKSCKNTKKSKPKGRASKRKKPILSKCNNPALLNEKLEKKTNKIAESLKKVKKIHGESLFREQIMLIKERGKLANRGKKFTFSTGMPSLGITSTPALNKDNLIGASNFLFLSPIIKEEVECWNGSGGCTPLKSKIGECKAEKTPKADGVLKRMSCRRVLRSGRMLNT